MVSELENIGPDIEYFVVPPLCPLVGSPYDFSRTAEHIERARLNTDEWLAAGGLERRAIPHELRPHEH
jgi:NTE family protein